MEVKTPREAAFDEAIATPPAKNHRTRPSSEARKHAAADKLKFDFHRLARLCDKRGIDPAEVVLDALSKDTDIDPLEKAKLAEKAMKYLYPQRKAVEMTGEGGGPIRLEGITIKLIKP